MRICYSVQTQTAKTVVVVRLPHVPVINPHKIFYKNGQLEEEIGQDVSTAKKQEVKFESTISGVTDEVADCGKGDPATIQEILDVKRLQMYSWRNPGQRAYYLFKEESGCDRKDEAGPKEATQAKNLT